MPHNIGTTCMISQAASKLQASSKSKVSLKDDAYERQLERTTGACIPIVQGIAVVLAAINIGIGSWSVSTYCTYTRANCSVDRLNAEGS